jgi:hypothetical protein
VSRRIDAPAERLFGLLVDPARHPGLDGSGMVQASSAAVITGLGDVFRVEMRNPEMGPYEIANLVVEFEPNRRIAWEPVLSAASRDEDRDGIGIRNGVRWSYELTAEAPNATLVTESYDCTRSPEWLRTAVKDGRRWLDSMTESLERLDRLSREA